MQKDALFWIWLAEALGPKSRDFRRLIELYETPYDLFHADELEIERIPGLTARTYEVLAQKDLSAASRILDICERSGYGILTFGDEAYPHLLRDLKEPPVVLYYCGTLPDFNSHLCIGMVGTRRMSAYGMQIAYKLSYELASVNAIVVSGMAAGIDGVCAAAALAAKGKTVAVLGCGLDIVYPKHHQRLMSMIGKDGAIISEYPPGTKPNYYHFPVRNRIISGLTQGTVVVEASVGSGSLITAKDAIVQGRDVFALPANVNSAGSEGTNRLLRDGAKLVLDASDIVRHYEFAFSKTLLTEELIKATQASRADLHYLDRIGVIELTKRAPKSQKEKAGADPELTGKEDSPKETARTPVTQSQKTVTQKPKREAQSQTTGSSTPKSTPDAVLSALTPVQLTVLEGIPDDRAISADQLQALGCPYGDTIAALTMLEIMGLIQKLPGGLYTKS